MDNVKQFLAVLKKHHFWVLCGVVILVTPIAWMWSTGSLADIYLTNKSEVDRKFTSLQQVASNTEHPTEAFTTAVGEHQKKLSEVTLQSWQAMYNEQAPVFKWPDEVPELQNLPLDASLRTAQRNEYMNYVENEFPRLYDLVQLRQEVLPMDAPGVVDGRPRPPARGQAVEYEGIVEWRQDQRTLIESRFRWGTTPSELAVRLAHEDLTVYRALLGAIRAANDEVGATDYLNAAVKRIDQLEIGQAVFENMSGGKLESNVLMPPGAADGTQVVMSSPASGGGDGTSSADDVLLGESRYQTADGQPLTVGQARDNPPFAEFKQMPVRMLLTVDQRRIPELLTACANSPLTIEVRQVRVNPGPNPIVASVRAQTEAGSATSRSAPSSAALNNADDAAAVNNASVLINGVVYIYNPPDAAKLGTGAAGAAPAAPSY